MKLAEQRCEPCEGGMPALSEDEAEELATQTPDWQVEPDHIERTFKFADFVTAMDFANKIAKLAEEQNHHPDLHISYGKVRVELSTHSVDGLSKNDFILAAKIDRLYQSLGELL
jgi:4a-hydroxytetrahydrobiopterin dehydratase